MQIQSYVQRQINARAPLEAKPTQVVCFNITLAAKDGRILLEFDQADCPGQDYIGIKEDCVVQITLHGDQLFFSKDLDAITTKQELTSFYGGLIYDGYDKALDRYKKVSFHARHNGGGKAGTIHAFNVNIDFLQTMAEKEPRWIALTIDPDIKNPLPTNR